MSTLTLVDGLQLKGDVAPEHHEILTPEAQNFLVNLHRTFNPQREALLARREEVQANIDAGHFPDFIPGTQEIRTSEWTVAPLPADLQDRRVEITGPVDRKMVINAMNSGANMFMADFEDSNSPTLHNNLNGQINLRDANRRTITFTNPGNNKFYQLNDHPATLLVRPRGWHLVDKHLLVDGQPISGSLMDFGLYFFHNAQHLLNNGSGPYFYLPKLESHLEARLWNEVFNHAQDALGIARGSIKATVLIENILAAFEMHEILWELRDHSAGLNCGRWDYIFSVIKKFRKHPAFVLPDRAEVTMTVHFMRSYSKLVIQTCHKRGVHAMGGMAAQIPIKNDEDANEKAIAKVRADKEREAKDGHDGTWVAHPGLVKLAKDVFDEHMPQANQIDHQLPDLEITQADLLKMPDGHITEHGLRLNINVGIQYIEAWLGGNGCVPIYNLMEDAATAEISRAQVWQWIHVEGVKLEDGRPVTGEMLKALVPEELAKIRELVGEDRYTSGHYEKAAELFQEMCLAERFEDFLTLPAYDIIA